MCLRTRSQERSWRSVGNAPASVFISQVEYMEGVFFAVRCRDSTSWDRCYKTMVWKNKSSGSPTSGMRSPSPCALVILYSTPMCPLWFILSILPPSLVDIWRCPPLHRSSPWIVLLNQVITTHAVQVDPHCHLGYNQSHAIISVHSLNISVHSACVASFGYFSLRL